MKFSIVFRLSVKFSSALASFANQPPGDKTLLSFSPSPGIEPGTSDVNVMVLPIALHRGRQKKIVTNSVSMGVTLLFRSKLQLRMHCIRYTT